MPQQDATCTGNYGKYYSQRLVVTIYPAEVANNRTYVTLAAYLYCNNQYSGPYSDYTNSTLTYYVDGGAVLSSSIKFRTKTGGGSGSPYTSSSPYQYLDGNNNAVVWGGYIGHNSDGTRSFTAAVSTSLVGNSNLTGGTVLLSVTLPTIPRASTVSLSNGTFNIGETITVNINRASGSFTHKVELLYGSVTKTLATGIQVSYYWDTGSDASTLYGQIPSAQRGNGTIRVTTYNGSTQIGDPATVSFTACVTNSNPVIGNASYTATQEALTGDNQVIIKGYSDVTVTWPKATPQNYASISKYIVSVGGAQQTITDTTSAHLTATFPGADGGKIDVVAVDSRGLQSSAPTLTAQVIPYTPLSITAASAQRDNGVDSMTTLDYAGKLYNDSLGAVTNALTACYYTYASGSGSPVTGHTAITPTITDAGTMSFSGSIWGDEQASGFAVGGSYTITLHLSDKLSSATQSVTLNSGTPGMLLHRNDDGSYVFSVGRSSDEITGLDIGGLLYLNGGLYASGRNMLLNSNFLSPINQRGFDMLHSLAATYTIDRWIGQSMTVNDRVKWVSGRGMELYNTGAMIRQISDDDERVKLLAGKKVTLSLKLTGSVQVTLLTGLYNPAYDYQTLTASGGIVSLTFDVPSSIGARIGATIRGAQSGSSYIEWVKLEPGDKATLYIPPDKSEEINKCKWYYQDYQVCDPGMGVGETEAWIRTMLPVMRVLPTVTVNYFAVFCPNGWDAWNLGYTTGYDLENSPNKRCLFVTAKGGRGQQALCGGPGILRLGLDAEIYS